jgi:hypothetical protein
MINNLLFRVNQYIIIDNITGANKGMSIMDKNNLIVFLFCLLSFCVYAGKKVVDFEDAKIPGMIKRGAMIISEQEKVISGRKSLAVRTTGGKVWNEFFVIDNIPKGKLYTIRFDYKCTHDVDDYIYVIMRTYSSIKMTNFGRLEIYKCRKGETGTGVFKADVENFSHSRLIFGIKNRGGIIIDNIIIEDKPSLKLQGKYVYDFNDGDTDKAVVTSLASIENKKVVFKGGPDTTGWHDIIKASINTEPYREYKVSMDIEATRKFSDYYSVIARVHRDEKSEDLHHHVGIPELNTRKKIEFIFDSENNKKVEIIFSLKNKGEVNIDNLIIEKVPVGENNMIMERTIT